MRALLSSLVCVALVGVVAAEEKAADKKGKTVTGMLKSYKDGTLTIAVKGKKGEEPKATEFKVASDAKVTVIDGDNKSEKTAADAFKDAKENTAVAVVLDGDKVTTVTVGNAPKKPK